MKQPASLLDRVFDDKHELRNGYLLAFVGAVVANVLAATIPLKHGEDPYKNNGDPKVTQIVPPPSNPLK